jgi:hypothetical protein
MQHIPLQHKPLILTHLGLPTPNRRGQLGEAICARKFVVELISETEASPNIWTCGECSEFGVQCCDIGK